MSTAGKNPEPQPHSHEILMSGLKVWVKTLTGKKFAFNVQPEMTIFHVKSMIEEKEGVPLAQQGLIYAGKSLHDGNLIRQYDIENESVLDLVARVETSPERRHSLTEPETRRNLTELPTNQKQEFQPVADELLERYQAYLEVLKFSLRQHLDVGGHQMFSEEQLNLSTWKTEPSELRVNFNDGVFGYVTNLTYKAMKCDFRLPKLTFPP